MIEEIKTFDDLMQISEETNNDIALVAYAYCLLNNKEYSDLFKMI